MVDATEIVRQAVREFRERGNQSVKMSGVINVVIKYPFIARGCVHVTFSDWDLGLVRQATQYLGQTFGLAINVLSPHLLLGYISSL